MLKWGMVPLVAAAALGLATAVQAADLYEPPVVVPPVIALI